MIVVTGGAGFIGSALIWRLNQEKHSDILLVDELGTGQKWKNIAKSSLLFAIHQDDFWPWLEKNRPHITGVFHMGACSTTTEEDADFLMRNNVQYSMALFEFCTRAKIPFIYASSAATYGLGELGFSDDPKFIPLLRPINKYGYSKQLFDCWVLKQKKRPPLWMGLKFFNVYGPHEYHKGSQASVVMHAFPQVKDRGTLKLFKSERSDFKDGEQKRDFIYIKDVVDFMIHVWTNRSSMESGIFNLGTGKARTFIDLGNAVFAALGRKSPKFEWIPMPENVRQQYQYFTEAHMDRARKILRYKKAPTSLEDGVRDYVVNYLNGADGFL